MKKSGFFVENIQKTLKKSLSTQAKAGFFAKNTKKKWSFRKKKQQKTTFDPLKKWLFRG